MGWKRIKTTFFIFWYFCRKAALWEAYREKFCDSEFFCWYLVLFSFGQQDGYEVKSVRALGKIMRPQPLFWSWLRPERKCVYDSKGISYFAKNRKCKTHFYTFLHMCKWIFWVYTCVSGFFWVYTCVSGFFLGLHMCKWIFLVYTCVSGFFFDLHILTHPYTSIHIHTHSGILWSFWFMLSYNDIIWYETKPN